MAATAEYFSVTMEELQGANRSRTLVNARQIAMYLCRELTELSLPRIGASFGGKDHTTVMHARSEEHTSELQSRQYLVCRLLLEKKNKTQSITYTRLLVE